jgi:hypothetical protein
VVLLVPATSVYPQKKKPAGKAKPAVAEPVSELQKLRDEYLKATKEYKTSLERLLAMYQESARKAEARVNQTKRLLADGLVSQRDVEQSESALTAASLKVTTVQQQIVSAETQMAQTVLEVDAEKQIAKLGPVPKGGMIRSTSFIRYAGTGSWLLSEAGKIESFFQQTFKRPLPIAVFGQGAIHNQWRLDHHNAMDVSLHPDGPEGQALINFLHANGIPFLAFRGAIPGVATGPHIHIGMPSHRY